MTTRRIPAVGSVALDLEVAIRRDVGHTVQRIFALAVRNGVVEIAEQFLKRAATGS